MKRSEMQRKICELLERQSHQGTAYMFKAQEILELIEREDTLPPETDVTKKRQIDDTLEVTYIVRERIWDEE